VALHRLNAPVIAVLWLLAGCNDPRPAGQSESQPIVEAAPETTATADVDRRATLALKQSLLTSFPQNSPSAAVEAGLIKEGYACDPNPAAPAERACLKIVRDDACEINTIVRTNPYLPEKAQVIRICATNSPAAKK
jgi:hypothetical protein